MSDFFHNLTHVLVHSARHAEKHGNYKVAGVALLIIGFFLTPMLVGIPMMVYGFCLLFK